METLEKNSGEKPLGVVLKKKQEFLSLKKKIERIKNLWLIRNS